MVLDHCADTLTDRKTFLLERNRAGSLCGHRFVKQILLERISSVEFSFRNGILLINMLF